MIGLKNVRVIIVDDKENEALPVIKALSKIGIPCAYFTGGIIAEFPDTPFVGVRLAILDMDLVEGVGSEKSRISTLMACLEKLLDLQNGPYTVLIWTNNPGLKTEFEKTIYANVNLPNPIAIEMLTKVECKVNGIFNISMVEEKLNSSFESSSPLKLIQAWEGKNIEAASDVTNVLSTIVTTEKDPKKWRAEWKVQLLNLMYQLSEAAVGKKLDTNTTLPGLFNALNPLHADRMENNTGDLLFALSTLPDEILKHQKGSAVDHKAEINTMLHLAFDDNTTLDSGVVYCFAPSDIPVWIPKRKKLLDDFLHDNSKKQETLSEIEPNCHLAIIEISPSCDHAQKNIRECRFLAGLFILESNIKKVKSANYIWDIGPLKVIIGRKAGIYHLYFSTRQLLTSSLETASRLQPYARLRNQALIDLQARFAQHAARPGMIYIK